MSRKERKYHFIYKTVCLITNKFYIGMHSTSNLDDGYLGSGKYLWHSINKHGKENHKLTILEYLDDRKSLGQREKEIVNESFLENPMCMNLKIGGEGGGKFYSEEHQLKCSKAGGRKVFQLLAKRHCDKLKNDPVYKKKYSETLSKAHSGKGNGFYGKKHSEETKEKMKLSHKGTHIGKLNSQYGKCWIYNIEEKQSIRIKKEELNSFLKKGWLKGRKMKF